jgi:hypothetical protein
MLRICPEVAAMQVPEQPIRADVRRLVSTVARVYGLATFKEEERRPWTMVSIHESDMYAPCVWDLCCNIHGQRMYPFLVDTEHMDDQVCRTLCRASSLVCTFDIPTKKTNLSNILGHSSSSPTGWCSGPNAHA